MNTNQKFKDNMARFFKLQSAIEAHGLKINQGVVIDTTLPETMHSIVCNVDYRSIDLSREINLEDFKEIHAYINGGRERKITIFQNEQGEMRKFFGQQD